MRALSKLSDEQVGREVDFIEESLGVAAGGVVLDLGCGAGHHAVELASRGYGVVGYDLSLSQLALAADVAQERGQRINFLQGDMREMAFEEMFAASFAGTPPSATSRKRRTSPSRSACSRRFGREACSCSTSSS